ncbi:serine/threonine protein kinase [Micromonospora zingiberis]|uniref:non-specific serine/threonine protein kinase n=1 Tax=Micromonospora zingiberis TaxID=2053011 RepID=A0A4R0GUM4_9ACTN|nr:serine/threonine-protein kinase [Micromonospora zingiberis]TCC00384.1 serine/threonine protein kinase [Micromonospora zingiberis]
MSPFTPNLRLHDRYVVRDRIGLGGMSEVWRADDEVLGRPVAVKVLAATFAADPDLRATIRREARAAARLAHPHVTQVYDYGEATLDGAIVPYLVMELVDGRNLADRLGDGPLPWPAALRMAAQVAAALAAAHRIGVVHRDIKPGNVMLTETGAKVLDFGIAALAGPRSAGTGRAAAEPMMGTPAYTAPERLQAAAPNPASDVYALGVLLYRTLTGDVPLPVRSWEDALVVHANRRPVPPLRVPGLPAGVAELVLACLDPDPARRPTAGQLAARLRAGATGPVGPATAMLPIISGPAGTDQDMVTSVTGPPPAHPPTLVDRTGTWSATATPSSGSWSATTGPPAGMARPGGPVVPPGGAGRSRRSRPPVGVVVAAALVLLVGFGAVQALGDDTGDGQPTAAPASSPAAPPTSVAPAPTRPSPTPSPAQPDPVNLRGLATEFIAMLTEGQLTDDIDRKVADRLRKDLAKLAAGKPKDREKRIDDLRERIEEEAEQGRIPADFAARMDDLLDRIEATLPEDDDDDD